MIYNDQGSSSQRIPEDIELPLHMERVLKKVPDAVQMVSTALSTTSSIL